MTTFQIIFIIILIIGIIFSDIWVFKTFKKTNPFVVDFNNDILQSMKKYMIGVGIISVQISVILFFLINYIF